MSADAAGGEPEIVTSGPDAFDALLFGRVPPEDVAPLGQALRQRLVEGALARLRRPRRPGDVEVALEDVETGEDDRHRALTVLEVVNDDMPFLLDSTLAELVGRGLEPRLVAHPILAVERDPDGALRRLVGEAGVEPVPGAKRESFIHVELDPIADAGDRAALVQALRLVYADVRAVAADAARMRGQIADLAGEYRSNPPPLAPDEVGEAASFLDWLASGHFTLLGMRAHRLPDGQSSTAPVEGSGLGLLRDPAVEVLRRGRELVAITPEIRAFLERPEALIITKASVKSRVQRRAYLDYVGAKLFAPSGRLWGELAMVGLFTPAAYTSPAAATPYLRRKVQAVLDRAGFDPSSFAGRALTEILESYPRDELFQTDEDTLYEFALELLRLSEHPRIRALVRADRFGRFVSVIVYVPKERYDTNVRRLVGDFLARTFGGRVSAAYPAYPEGPLARTHFIIGRDEGTPPEVSREMLERGIAAITRTWADRLADALLEKVGRERAAALGRRYSGAFGAAYRENFDASQGLADIEHLERLSDERPRALAFYRREGDGPSRINLKLFSAGTGLPLSERVPLLERMGFRVVNERTYGILPAGGEAGRRVWLHDMALERANGEAVEVAAVGGRLEAALLAVFRGLAESDGFNGLVLAAGLGWRDAALLRTYGRYLRQITVPYGQEYLADALARHPEIAAELVRLFYALLEPGTAERRSEAGERDAPSRAERDAASRAERDAACRARIDELLRDVTSLDDDRILRRFLNLVDATLRTNFFQIAPNGLPVPVIAFKLDCRRVEGIPRPTPLFEIFMSSPRLEALHLRFGKVARGGLRWTDRPQDFRTEVLGLVKAQQVKNAVIVPVGAKGGFFPKQLPAPSDRTAWMAEGTETYRLFVRTLLDLTDNLEGDRVLPPPDTVRRDGDDPYLVVAADKGTATFSDVANAISLEKGHWLGDAFASGGSNGYDHKAMGITARGAWEAVKRHFREMDVDIQTQPVTVAGVGDMSGDVFGNGMLLSTNLKLVAAFDHRDIFLDPDPDPERSYAERRRLFGLPRSSWADYDRALISPGGGVFPRSAKSMTLSPEARAALGFDRSEATPAEIVSAILRAPVGLLWFGGIGTYVRASTETDADAGDRANDPVRIEAGALRAQVIGEGANLGMTQRGRIEAARRGIRLNTDAIDNSAGVNTSDVEVNIKIALATAERDGRLSFEDRNALLAAMTDEVGELVLRNNYLQTLALSLSERRGAGELGFLQRLMQVLEAQGRLDRGLEFLPDEAAIEARRQAGEGLTRPELSVLLAYAKLALHDELLASAVPDDPYLGRELERYFPAPLRDRFPDAVASHRLRREIIATQLANAIVNRGGPAIVVRLADETGADAPTIAAGYAATRDSFGLSELYGAIDALDGQLPGGLQLDLYGAVQDLMLSRLVWFIRNVDLRQRSLDEVVGTYRAGIAAVAASLREILPEPRRAALEGRIAALVGRGVPAALAERLAALQDLVAAPDIVLVARRAERPIPEVARVHFAVDGAFRLGRLSGEAIAVPVADHYDRLARDRAVDSLAAAHRRITAQVAALPGEPDRKLASWIAGKEGEPARISGAVDAMAASGLSVSKLSVAASLLGDLARE